jgi:hypothetical protein
MPKLQGVWDAYSVQKLDFHLRLYQYLQIIQAYTMHQQPKLRLQLDAVLAMVTVEALAMMGVVLAKFQSLV